MAPIPFSRPHATEPPPGGEELAIHAGEILDGKYRVERVLGAGGMGVVVAATHLRLDKMVALKFVLPSVSGGPASDRFIREARAAARLKSEHVARVLDFGTLATGAHYIVMEYLEGCDLAQLLLSVGPIDVALAVDYVRQACAAVGEAHGIGLVHRDLKPQNLFLTEDFGGETRIKVLDFGIAKFRNDLQPSLTNTSHVLGSPFYTAPERLRSSGDVDPRSDVWSLGVILYELLSGRLPFDAPSAVDVCLAVVRDAPRSLAELRPDVPTSLASIVLRCLAKSPEARFADASALGSALETFTARAPHDVELQRTAVLQTRVGASLAPVVHAAPHATETTGSLADVSAPRTPTRHGGLRAAFLGTVAFLIASGAVGFFASARNRVDPVRAPAKNAAPLPLRFDEHESAADVRPLLLPSTAPSALASQTSTRRPPPVAPVRASSCSSAPLLRPLDDIPSTRQ